MSAAQIKRLAEYRRERGEKDLSQAAEYRRLAHMKLVRAQKLIAEALELEEKARELESS